LGFNENGASAGPSLRGSYLPIANDSVWDKASFKDFLKNGIWPFEFQAFSNGSKTIALVQLGRLSKVMNDKRASILTAQTGDPVLGVCERIALVGGDMYAIRRDQRSYLKKIKFAGVDCDVYIPVSKMETFGTQLTPKSVDSYKAVLSGVRGTTKFTLEMVS
jgi:hypothetical protein